MKKYSEYKIWVSAHTEAGYGNESDVQIHRTKTDNPQKPENLQARNVTHNSLNVTWSRPNHTYGHLLYYEVQWIPTDLQGKVDHGSTNRSHDEFICSISGLLYEMNFTISVRGFTIAPGGGNLSTITVLTEKLPENPPDRETRQFLKEHLKETTFPMRLYKIPNDFGEVMYYQVIVCKLDSNALPTMKPDNFAPSDKLEDSTKSNPYKSCYISAEFESQNFTEQFIVGDSTTYPKMIDFANSGLKDPIKKYVNAPAEHSTFYTAFQRSWIQTKSNGKQRRSTASNIQPLSGNWMDVVKTKTPPDPPSPVWPIIVAVLVCLLLVVAAGVFIYVKRRRNANGNGQKEDDGGDVILPPIGNLYRRDEPVAASFFEHRVQMLKQDSGLKYEEEYYDLDPDEDLRTDHGDSNRDKNRWRDIVPYDHSRVILKSIPGVYGSDYINGNYVDGYKKTREYIATQGPLENTVQDFWRMIWENNSSVIVMLTNIIENERPKCEKYWPDQGAHVYGLIRVNLVNEIVLSDHTVRYLGIQHTQESQEERMVQQFHYTAWPDKSVPVNFTSLLSFIKKSSSANGRSQGSMVVHCSAGVGRTGTFIVLDTQLKRMAYEDSLDVFGCVRYLRSCRRLMVQTEEQYKFVHEVLLDRIINGDTETEFKYLSDYTRRLKYRDPETETTGIESEFNRLNPIPITGDLFTVASQPFNKTKNRYANVLPFDKTRVSLQMIPGVDGSDYINANFIGGYQVQNEYIATQAPIPDTIVDFWRMVWEYNCHTIVMLSKEMEGGRVRVHRYWPNKAPTPIGDIIMEMTSEMTYSDYTLREFKISHTKVGAARVIHHYQFTVWPDSGVPNTGTGLVDLIGQVQRWQHQNNLNSAGFNPTVVHCGAGCGRTGVFITLSILIERLKAEGLVDVFNTVRGLRRNRPAMVQSQEQYEFIYFVLQEYLDSFEQYGNLN